MHVFARPGGKPMLLVSFREASTIVSEIVFGQHIAGVV